jgi:hypothetical protein
MARLTPRHLKRVRKVPFILLVTLWLIGAAHAQELMTGSGTGTCGGARSLSEQTEARHCVSAHGFVAAPNAALFRARRMAPKQAFTWLFSQRRRIAGQQGRHPVSAKPNRRANTSSKDLQALCKDCFLLMVVFFDLPLELPLQSFPDLESCIVAAVDHDFKSVLLGVPTYIARAVCWELDRRGHVVEIHVPGVQVNDFVAAATVDKISVPQQWWLLQPHVRGMKTLLKSEGIALVPARDSPPCYALAAVKRQQSGDLGLHFN